MLCTGLSCVPPKENSISYTFCDKGVSDGVSLNVVRDKAGNIEKLETSYVNTLNVYDILKAGKIILTKDALKGVEEVYA